VLFRSGAGLVETGFAATLGGHVPDAQLGSLAFWWRFYTFHLAAIAGWLVLVACTGPTRCQQKHLPGGP